MGRKRVRAAERLARKKRVFSISKLHGSSGDAEIEERRERVLKKSRSLTFPPEVLSNYRLPSIRMRYGWDVSSGGHMGLLALHKRKLDVILNDLILRHLWPQAAGVLSVLLRAFFAEQDWDVRHTPHFWAAMEVMRQVGGLEGNDLKTRRMYQILHDKQPKGGILCQDKLRSGAIRLELALYLMSIKQYDDAQLASSPFLERPPYRDHAVANLIHGLIYYHQWCELIAKEVDATVDMKVHGHVKIEQVNISEGMGENEGMFSHNSIQPDRNSNGEYSFGPDVDVLSQSVSTFHADRHNPSIKQGCDEKEEQASGHNDSVSTFDFNSCEGNVSTKRTKEMVFDAQEESQWNFYDEGEDDNQRSYINEAKVIYNQSLDRNLFPFRPSRLCIGENYVVSMKTVASKILHTNAIKYLRKTLSLDNNTTSALLPLIQLLLAGGDVEGAFEEIMKCCEGSRHSIPYRIMCSLLESLTPKNREMLIHFYETLVEIDPAYTHAVEGLINMHNAGGYRTESLLHHLSLHLDGCPGSLLVWKKLVLSFQRLNNVKRDDTPLLFLQEEVYDAWIIRERWWPNKHFRIDQIQEESKTMGTLWIVYKAAAAAHIFGSSMGYVYEVKKYLEMRRKHDRIRKLRKYVESAFDLFPYLRNRCIEEDILCQSS